MKKFGENIVASPNTASNSDLLELFHEPALNKSQTS